MHHDPAKGRGNPAKGVDITPKGVNHDPERGHQNPVKGVRATPKRVSQDPERVGKTLQRVLIALSVCSSNAELLFSLGPDTGQVSSSCAMRCKAGLNSCIQGMFVGVRTGTNESERHGGGTEAEHRQDDVSGLGLRAVCDAQELQTSQAAGLV